MSETELSPDDLTAAEYVLGVLTASERDAVERRLASEPTLRAEVAAWEARLTPLIEAVPPQTPPAVVWRRIAAQVGLPAAPRRKPDLWSNLGFWRGAAGTAGMAAAASIAALILTPRATPPASAVPTPSRQADLTSVALLKPEAGPAAFAVAYDRERQVLIITPVSAEGQADRSLQLWLMPDGTPPVSLGLLDPNKPLVLRVDQLAGPEGPRATLGVSLEPLGGAPGGQPTGPVVATGRLAPV
jgi:anti-sigma-K factor RskA